MAKYLTKVRVVLIILSIIAFILTILCLTEIIPYAHHYPYLFIVASFFLFLYLLSFGLKIWQIDEENQERKKIDSGL